MFPAELTLIRSNELSERANRYMAYTSNVSLNYKSKQVDENKKNSLTNKHYLTLTAPLYLSSDWTPLLTQPDAPAAALYILS